MPARRPAPHPGAAARQRLAVAGAIVALASLAFPAAAQLVDAVEYYNAPLDHYFVTASADEIAKLDGGVFPGWQRTGQRFSVLDPATAPPPAGMTPVCRFYGSPAAGLDSHFYSASPAECDDVARRFAGVWLLESSDVFGVYLPDAGTGACPAGSVPIYRSWNNRADSNHRYTSDLATQQAMIARGYVAEGYGPTPVAMCSPQATVSPPPEPPPVCTLSASADSETPATGSLVALVATCSNSPTSYEWSGGCVSTTNVCRLRRSAAGPVAYGVTATNGSGSGSAAVNVTWVTSAAPPSGQCGSFPSALYTDVGAASTSAYSLFYGDNDGFQWNGAWAVRFTVPATASTGQFGSLIAAEFGGPPTFREVSVSRFACDFRATDPTGNNGPLGRAIGDTATVSFITGTGSASLPGLVPGQTYYFNVRNYAPSSGTITCASSTQRCDAIATINLPH